MIRKIVTLLFVLSFAINGKAQDFQLGKVTIEELEEKQHPKDTSAVAAVLFKNGKTTLDFFEGKGFVLQTVVRTRIKIYKKEGYDWANQAIEYSLDSSPNETVDFSQAVTYNLVDGKIEKTKLKSEGVFVETINKYWNRKKIMMPNVKVGSVVEYEYVIKSPNIVHPRNWDFQTKIPVNSSEYITSFPSHYMYNTTKKGFVNLFLRSNTETKKMDNSSSFPLPGGGFNSINTSILSPNFKSLTKTSSKL